MKRTMPCGVIPKGARISKRDLVYLEAKALNNAIGNTYRVVTSQHGVERATCERVVGPAVRLEPGKARGSNVWRRKGGVISGMKVF